MTSKKHNTPEISIIKVISNLFLTMPILWSGYEFSLFISALTYREIGGFILFSFGGVAGIIVGIFLGQFLWDLVTGTINAIIKKDISVFYNTSFIGNIIFLNVENRVGTPKLKFKNIIFHIIFGIIGIAGAYGLRYATITIFPEELPIMINQLNECIFITSLIMIAGSIVFTFENNIIEKIKKNLVIIVPIILVLLMIIGAIRLILL